MKKFTNIITLLFLFQLTGCRESDSNIKKDSNQKNYGNTIKILKSIIFHQEPLKCLGNQYSAFSCFDEKKNLSISFSSDAKTISFLQNKNNYTHKLDNSFGDLGYQTYLFVNNKEEIILLDIFLENGHLYNVYYIDSISIKFLGKKEIVFNEEQGVSNNLKVQRKENTITILLKNSLENLQFNIDQAKNISIDNTASITKLMDANIDTPEKIVNYLIFKKEKNNKLIIDESILNYIQTHTTETQNKYVLALDKYVTNEIRKYKDGDKSEWNKEEIMKIIAYASNTTDPLFKKYWIKSPENWHNGKWGNILSFCSLVYQDSFWKELLTEFDKNNYYNLPNLEEMTQYASEFDKIGPPEN